MKFFFFVTFLFLTSCAELSKNSSERLKNSSWTYNLKDRTGEYRLRRLVKVVGSKIATKNEVLSNELSKGPLEKTVIVSELGSVKSKNGRRPALRPTASEHVIWFDKKRYFTSMSVDTKNKSLEVRMESPDKEWTGSKSFSFPKGSAFCFFSQIPECVQAHGYLRERKSPKEIQVVWDSYPYHSELYNGISKGPFVKGVWAYDKVVDGNTRFGLLIEGQLILYDFNETQELRNVYWVAQGYSLTIKEE